MPSRYGPGVLPSGGTDFRSSLAQALRLIRQDKLDKERAEDREFDRGRIERSDERSEFLFRAGVEEDPRFTLDAEPRVRETERPREPAPSLGFGPGGTFEREEGGPAGVGRLGRTEARPQGFSLPEQLRELRGEAPEERRPVVLPGQFIPGLGFSPSAIEAPPQPEARPDTRLGMQRTSRSVEKPEPFATVGDTRIFRDPDFVPEEERARAQQEQMIEELARGFEAEGASPAEARFAATLAVHDVDRPEFKPVTQGQRFEEIEKKGEVDTARQTTVEGIRQAGSTERARIRAEEGGGDPAGVSPTTLEVGRRNRAIGAANALARLDRFERRDPEREDDILQLYGFNNKDELFQEMRRFGVSGDPADRPTVEERIAQLREEGLGRDEVFDRLVTEGYVIDDSEE